MDEIIQRLLALDTQVQRAIYFGWPESWIEVKWPTKGATRALLLISMGYARTPGEVAERLRIGRTTVTGMLDQLEADRLITRRIDPDDRRSLVLELTDAGQDMVKRIDALRNNQLERAYALLAPADQEALATGLTALHRALQASHEQAAVEVSETTPQSLEEETPQ